MSKFGKFLLAVILFPITCLVVWQDVLILLGVLGNFRAAISFVLGAVVYSISRDELCDFSRPYVLMRAMTHAVAAMLCGVRIKDVHVGKESGYVKMNRTNTFIALAPYFVPGYVVLLAMVCFALEFLVDLSPYRQVILFLVGFFMTFHFIQTFHTLWETEQPDLNLAGGKFFSCVSIILVNMLVLAGVLKILFPQDVHLLASVQELVRQISTGGQIIVNYILEKIK